MSITVSIESSDLTRAIRQLERAKDKRLEKVRSVIFISTLNIETTAKDIVPIITGRLKGSIHSSWTNDRLTGNVSTNVIYASSVERRKPYMKPAADIELRRFEMQMKQALR